MSHDSSLEPVLRGVEPAARLVPERHLRAVLHYLIDWGAVLPTNPELPYWVSRSQLVAADVLPPRVMEGTEPALLLITDPNDRMIDTRTQAEQLRVFWSVLFEAAILQEIDRKLEAGSLTVEACKAKLNQFGAAVGREIRYVLSAEHLVAHDANDAACYRAFAAVYLCTATFKPHLLERLFPSLPHGDAVKRALAEDVDAPALLARTKLPHALEPPHHPAPDERWEAEDTLHTLSPQPVEDPQRMLGEASEAEQKGNNVRAAILRAQIVSAANTLNDQKDAALAGAETSIGKLVDALGEMFSWDEDTRQEWRQALKPLLEAAGVGVWPRAARCLYELQKIPADLSREVFAVDLAETIRTFGKRPVKRPLPRAKPVLILMGLRRAHSQLLRATLGHAAHLRLDRLFHHQLDHLEGNIRREFTPIIAETLTQAGLIALNRVEEVARDKLIAELIDRVLSRGYLRIGDLRDGIARNQLKLPDLRGPAEFFGGDPLLKADLHLAYALDGVYRKGEFYLRWLQRASSLFFATRTGRASFLYFLLPFLGGFMTVVGAQEMAHIGEKIYGFASKMVTGKGAAPASAPEPAMIRTQEKKVEIAPPDGKATVDEVEIDEETGEYIWEDTPHPVSIVRDVFLPAPTTLTKEPGHGQFHVPWDWVIGLSVFLFLVIHVSAFRRIVVLIGAYFWSAVRGLLWDIPHALWRSAVVRGIRLARPTRLLLRHLWSPLLLTAMLFGIMLLFGMNPRFLVRWGWAFWAALTLAYNTPWGWVVQDRVAEAVSDWWRVVRANLLPGLIATILDWFRRLGNWMERQLYIVDERLRFRGGDSQGSLVLKSLLGLAWFPIAYVFRFAFYLLLEPQINPVKHFPVVTVSHKLLLPLVPSLGDVFVKMTGWGVAKANGAAFSLIACVPGVFGFIAWELLSNWQIYAANRPKKLKPVMLGSHGETMRGLLRPGFHSGTVPKLFRKLRHDDHHGNHVQHELDHSVEGLQRFVERELVHPLSGVPEWSGVRLELGPVRLGCQRVAVELRATSLGPDAFVVGFENMGGVIEATVEQVGWVEKLTQSQRSQFVAALRGILDMGAADRVDGKQRCDELPPAGTTDFADLARRVSWAEWSQRWNTEGKAVPTAGIRETA